MKLNEVTLSVIQLMDLNGTTVIIGTGTELNQTGSFETGGTEDHQLFYSGHRETFVLGAPLAAAAGPVAQQRLCTGRLQLPRTGQPGRAVPERQRHRLGAFGHVPAPAVVEAFEPGAQPGRPVRPATFLRPPPAGAVGLERQSAG